LFGFETKRFHFGARSRNGAPFFVTGQLLRFILQENYQFMKISFDTVADFPYSR